MNNKYVCKMEENALKETILSIINEGGLNIAFQTPNVFLVPAILQVAGDVFRDMSDVEIVMKKRSDGSDISILKILKGNNTKIKVFNGVVQTVEEVEDIKYIIDIISKENNMLEFRRYLVDDIRDSIGKHTDINELILDCNVLILDTIKIPSQAVNINEIKSEFNIFSIFSEVKFTKLAILDFEYSENMNVPEEVKSTLQQILRLNGKVIANYSWVKLILEWTGEELNVPIRLKTYKVGPSAIDKYRSVKI